MVRFPGAVNTISHIGIHNATKILQRHLHPSEISGIGNEIKNIFREIDNPVVPTVPHTTTGVTSSFNPLQFVHNWVKSKMEDEIPSPKVGESGMTKGLPLLVNQNHDKNLTKEMSSHQEIMVDSVLPLSKVKTPPECTPTIDEVDIEILEDNDDLRLMTLVDEISIENSCLLEIDGTQTMDWDSIIAKEALLPPLHVRKTAK